MGLLLGLGRGAVVEVCVPWACAHKHGMHAMASLTCVCIYIIYNIIYIYIYNIETKTICIYLNVCIR